MFRKAKPESKCRRVPTQICKKKKCEKRRYIYISNSILIILRLPQKESDGGGVQPIISLRGCYTSSFYSFNNQIKSLSFKIPAGFSVS